MIISHRVSAALLLLAAIVLSNCAPTAMIIDDSEYHVSDYGASELIANMPNYNPILFAVNGDARAQVSRPGESERATVYFTSSRDTSLLRIRNQLGIEGGRVLSHGDSVTLFNRIDEIAQRFSREEAASHYLSGITAMNLVEILNPLIELSEISRVYESENRFLLQMNNGTRFFLTRYGLVLERIEFPARSPQAFSTFIFQHHATINGYRLPRRIQILSSDQKSNIFLLIRSLEVNPSTLDFDLSIPADISIERI